MNSTFAKGHGRAYIPILSLTMTALCQVNMRHMTELRMQETE